jgi:hypothetical protein
LKRWKRCGRKGDYTVQDGDAALFCLLYRLSLL